MQQMASGEKAAKCLDWLLYAVAGPSDIFTAVGTVDIIFECQETSTDQRRVALFAVEAVIVPLAILKGDVLAASETWGGNSREESHDVCNPITL